MTGNNHTLLVVFLVDEEINFLDVGKDELDQLHALGLEEGLSFFVLDGGEGSFDEGFDVSHVLLLLVTGRLVVEEVGDVVHSLGAAVASIAIFGLDAEVQGLLGDLVALHEEGDSLVHGFEVVRVGDELVTGDFVSVDDDH